MRSALAKPGYAGLANAALLAQNGEATGVDPSPERVAQVDAGQNPAADGAAADWLHPSRIGGGDRFGAS
ncbi:hypothetical protein [Paracoccus simplex]|uniref:Uncharacterized protein n=1 Tax=Paracoccus simplex TaxID=2086346 RepID=A0ABV7S1Q2_9RHOB